MIKNQFELDYKALLYRVLNYGSIEENRTGVNCFTCFGEDLMIDLSEGLLPIITSKKIFHKKAFHEYIWIREGLTTLTYLNQNNINWWDEYANNKGSLGKTYGYQLRNFNGHFDQLDYVVRQIKLGTRRAHATLWNPCELNESPLPCCYTGLTFVLTNNGKTLNLNIDFRSSDLFLGLPYDMLFGAFLLKDVSNFCEKQIGKLKLNLNNAHIYMNHVDQVNKYLEEKIYDLPLMVNYPDIKYKHGPIIEAKLNN